MSILLFVAATVVGLACAAAIVALHEAAMRLGPRPQADDAARVTPLHAA